jgi:hypothetical protein
MCLQNVPSIHKPHSNLYSTYKHFKAVLAVQNQLFLIFLYFPNFFLFDHSMLRKKKDQNGIALYEFLVS